MAPPTSRPRVRTKHSPCAPDAVVARTQQYSRDVDHQRPHLQRPRERADGGGPGELDQVDAGRRRHDTAASAPGPAA